MKNRWIEFFYGTVTVRVSGKGIERFIKRPNKKRPLYLACKAAWNGNHHF